MAIYRNPHNSSDLDSRITRQLGYKHTFCQNVVSTKNCLFSYFRKCWSIDGRSSFFCLTQNCVSVDYDKLIFQFGYFRLHVAEVL